MSDIGVVVIEIDGASTIVTLDNDLAVINTVSSASPEVVVVETGVPGPSGTQIIAVPFVDPWPPVPADPDTLYLRLEP